MTQRRRFAALLSLIVAIPLVGNAHPVHAAQGDLQLLTQSFNIGATGAFTATVGLPAKLVATDLGAADVVVTAYQRVERREALTGMIADPHQLPPADDSVVISPACCAGPGENQVSVTVPLEITEVRPDALSLPRSGLYPITIALRRGGQVVAQVLTFLHRLPGDGESTDDDPMAVAVAIATQNSIHLDSNATISVDSKATVEEMTHLADALDALAANKFNATVRIAPAVLNALRELDPTLFTRLTAALQSHHVELEPRWPIDPSAAAAASQSQLYTTWLRDGQDQLRQLGLGPGVISTSTVLVDQPIGGRGASLRRNLGAGLLVVTPSLYDGLHGSINVFTDYKGELVTANLPDGTAIDVAVVDHFLSDLFVHPMATPEMTRVYAVAHLLALRQSILTDGARPSRHAVVIATPEMGVPDATLLGSITSLIAATPGLAASTLDDVGFRTDGLLINDGQQAPVTFPDLDPGGVSARIFLQATLDNEIDGVASMLPADDDRPGQWHALVALLPTSALDDRSAAGIAASVRADLAQIRGAIQVPSQYTVNLPGRRSTVRIRFLNTGDVPLKIKVQLSSPSGKLVFSNPGVPIELEPGVPGDVAIPVVARSNGTSGVSLDVSTPSDDQLVPTIALKFRVRALGLGNVLTAVLFGLVGLWWLQHARSTWRRRRQAKAATLPAL